MITVRTTASLWAACAILSFGAPVAAQTSAPGPTSEQLQARSDAAVALALNTQPIAPDQLALGGRFMKALNQEAGLADTITLVFEPVREQVLSSLPANVPADRKATFMAALDEALGGMKADMRHELVTGLTRYYAASFDTAELQAITTYYESPLGQKSLLSPNAMTEAETQASGEYLLAHPEVFQVVRAALGAMQVTQGVMQREAPGLTAGFKTRLCASLTKRGANSATCATG